MDDSIGLKTKKFKLETAYTYVELIRTFALLFPDQPSTAVTQAG